MWATDLGKLVSLMAIDDSEVVLVLAGTRRFPALTLMRASRLVTLVIGWYNPNPLVLRM